MTCTHPAAHAQSPSGEPSRIERQVSAHAPIANSYQAYTLTHTNADGVEPLLQKILSQQPEAFRIVVNSQANQILLQGSAEVQHTAVELIHLLDRPIKGVAGKRQEIEAASSPPAHQPIGQLSSQSVNLKLTNAAQVSRQLRALLGSSLQPLTDSGVEDSLYAWHTKTDRKGSIRFELSRQLVTVSGSTNSIPQMIRILNAFDQDPSSSDALKVLRVRTEATELISQTANRIQQLPVRVGKFSRNSVSNGFQSLRQSPFASSLFTTAVTGDSAAKWSTDQRAQIASYQTGQNHSSVVAAQFELEATTDKANDTEQTTSGKLLRQLGLDVNIEVLPDLDVVILRGRDDEVERVADIIREIEQIADEVEAQIEVVSLKHTSSSALAKLVQSTSTTLLKGRQGRATVISLDTPNALLLIGWGEALKSIQELIDKLDTPVSPDAQMQVFHLQHANASQVGRSVTQFFSSASGLSAQVNVVTDLRSNSLVIRAAPRDMLTVENLIEQFDVSETAASEQVRIFKLAHTLASDLASTITTAVNSVRGTASSKSANLELLAVDAEGERIIKSGILDHVSIHPNTQTNTLVVTAPAESMELVAALIEQLDQPASTAQIKVFRIINGDANSMVLMLRSLLPTQTGSNTRPQLSGSEGETSLAPLRFSVERRTNSIIAAGSTGDLRIVEALLMRLDEHEMKRRRNTVYRLRNAPSVDVAQAINQFLISQQRIQRLAPGELSPFQLIESEVIVVPEPVSNSLIISATTRFYEDIMNLVEELDAQPPQVMIQVLIAEVGLGDVDEFGVELGLQDSVLFDRSLLSELVTTTNSISSSTAAGIISNTNDIVQGANNIPGFLFNNSLALGNSGSDISLNGSNRVGSQGISSFSVGRINDQLGFGGLVLSASSQSVSVLIRALQESRRLEVLSRPQIMTLDNQPAFVQVGQRVPYITESQLTNFGRVNQVELIDVGLILGVTPRISPDGMVVMEVDAEKSLVGPEEEGIPIAISPNGEAINSPKIDITTAQTTVSAASGETIILGGLITKRSKNIHRRVPLLGDIPLLGDLFRYDLVDTRRTELLIILTPRVILGPKDQERLKQVESARMSWCAADIHSLLGEGIYDEANISGQHSQVPIIYPDLNPRGLLDANPDEVQESVTIPDELPTDESALPFPIPADTAVSPSTGPLATGPLTTGPLTTENVVTTQWQAGAKIQPNAYTELPKAEAAKAPEKPIAENKRWNPLGWLRK
ncbi:MAG: secretin N-terminal domain-containing protein [Pirellulales bacterium]